ncbi:hypothetical protein ASPWEDRAFT_184745 [Aspergillus wentii DTO 134E9]|uniref:HMG box domain-containing protein n=1 Tax=Aspergillus wentii DTO 134E9 TaxID=1073089 RepID=A0A1L9RH11_ASPWE|nr:uncharacterized protein ASPWEDRAFT_184745 [Aspergillus wentii DTO 134E9]KAI9928002.1 hypothetical protein MW887_002854 [Aspergillus wentii]OJJ34229.1 hypothetical protein ASPWEDRAFT_184745 [Aspergillus wentii DTO 134E9]
MDAVPIAIKSSSESSDKATELLWQDALRHLDATNNEVLLPTNVIDMIGQSNVDKIKSRLCALIGAPVVAFVDESINALRVMRTPAFSGSAVSVASQGIVGSNMRSKAATGSVKSHGKPARPTKSEKVPRPPNAFILYRQHHHPLIKAAYPDLQNNNISIMLGKQWKAESDEVKTYYKALANEEKRKHAEIHPDYQYAPRKPSEKKRRASSRQHVKSTQPPMLPDSPASTTAPSNVSTPAMYPGMQMGELGVNRPVEDLAGLNFVLSPNDMQDDQFSFNAEVFDSMIQQVHHDHNKALMYQPYQQFEIPPQTVGDSFEFSDFITDCY